MATEVKACMHVPSSYGVTLNQICSACLQATPLFLTIISPYPKSKRHRPVITIASIPASPPRKSYHKSGMRMGQSYIQARVEFRQGNPFEVFNKSRYRGKLHKNCRDHWTVEETIFTIRTIDTNKISCSTLSHNKSVVSLFPRIANEKSPIRCAVKLITYSFTAVWNV